MAVIARCGRGGAFTSMTANMSGSLRAHKVLVVLDYLRCGNIATPEALLASARQAGKDGGKVWTLTSAAL